MYAREMSGASNYTLCIRFEFVLFNLLFGQHKEIVEAGDNANIDIDDLPCRRQRWMHVEFPQQLEFRLVEKVHGPFFCRMIHLFQLLALESSMLICKQIIDSIEFYGSNARMFTA